MRQKKIINGFSKMPRKKKIQVLSEIVIDREGLVHDLDTHLHPDLSYQKIYEALSENVMSNFYLPYSLAPNFIINNHYYIVPMVTNESSVVAAASAAAKYWAERGGFRSDVISAIKTGQIHFSWFGDYDRLKLSFDRIKPELISATNDLTENMRRRGGGIIDIELRNKTEDIPGYYQLHFTFDTKDAMGANFINSVLEKSASIFESLVRRHTVLSLKERRMEIIMSVLSNHSPQCVVETSVECSIDDLDSGRKDLSGEKFAEKFKMAIDIANIDINRAVTNNKGIYNGIDAVALATGNDFRALEAQGHVWAVHDGKYRGLSNVNTDGRIFRFTLRLPLTLGATGGITRIHPLAKRSFEIMGNPNSKELMQIFSAVGLASNFSAVKALVTNGIQGGHMRMYLTGILRNFDVNESELKLAKKYFNGKAISYKAVEQFIQQIRKDGDYQ